MTDSFLIIAGRPLDTFEVALFAALFVTILIAAFAWRASRMQARLAGEAQAQARELDDRLRDVSAGQSELAGRLAAMGHLIGERQSTLQQALNERLDTVSHRLGQGLVESARYTGDHLARLNERLAVVEGAGNAIGALADEVVGLKAILSNKQARGAFGQARLEAIIKDSLPAAAYQFQATLSNRTRPDCFIRLPTTREVLVIDAKFPLEAIAAWREAAGSEGARAAEQRVRADIGRHIDDIAGKYLIVGETQDIALMFVPSESLFADIQERFPDLVEKAFKARVLLVSPSLLMLAVQVVQSLVRDARMRDEARRIQIEVGKLVEDVRRVGERAASVEKHLRKAGEDVAGLMLSADKVTQRGLRIASVDLAESDAATSGSRQLAAE